MTEVSCDTRMRSNPAGLTLRVCLFIRCLILPFLSTVNHFQASSTSRACFQVSMASHALGPTPRPSLLDRVGIWTFSVVNKFIPWHKLPGLVGTLQLYLFRVEQREQNLYDGYASTSEQGNAHDFPLPDDRFLHARNSDGTYNSLEMPLMGCAGIRFGRNFSRKETRKPSERDLWTPNPRIVSERFMKRDKFIPATSLNLLAAAWIQFQIHDWFNHETVGAPLLTA